MTNVITEILNCLEEILFVMGPQSVEGKGLRAPAQVKVQLLPKTWLELVKLLI